MNKNLFAAIAITFAAVSFFTASSFAQVVNSNPSTGSATSQVTLSATVPSVVIAKVDASKSTLSKTIEASRIGSSTDASGTDFVVAGDVLANSSSASVQCTVSTKKLMLTNGGSSIAVNLSGTIGGTAISTTAMTPTFTSKKAAIAINGDIDDTTLTTTLEPGSYSGTLTITATLL